jgi:ribosomal protein S18 acetylase RimI-like enzyme
VKYLVRQYQQSDLAALAGFLNKNFQFDTLSEDLLEDKLTGDPFWDAQKALLCLDGSEIIGFMQSVIRDIRGQRFGYIKLMAVAQQYRRQGIASFLYRQLEKQFRQDRVDIVRIYDVPLNYFMPGIDPRYTEALCFAMRNGFERFGDTSNLIVDLQSTELDTDEHEQKLLRSGIEIIRPALKKKQQILDFVGQDWALWTHEVEMAFRDEPPSIHVAYLNSQIRAFSAYNGNNKGTGWFGPMGTHADLRGKGIGSILLKRCLKDMRDAGQTHSIIPWVGPIDFYAHHVGARVDRVFWRYQKQLKK